MRDSYIKIYDNALTEKECGVLISQFERFGKSQGGFYHRGQYVVDHSIKKCNELSSLNFSTQKYSIISTIIRQRLSDCLYKYEKKYSFLSELRWEVFNFYNFQKYDGESDGYKTWHAEHCLQAPNRILAWMFYLNNAKSGTEFMNYSTVRAKMGRCVIWPAFWTHPHRGVTPNKGLKYIVTGWVTLN